MTKYKYFLSDDVWFVETFLKEEQALLAKFDKERVRVEKWLEKLWGEK